MKLVAYLTFRTPQLRNIDFEDEFEDDGLIPDEDEAQGATIRHLLPTAPATATTSIVQNRNNSLSRVSHHRYVLCVKLFLLTFCKQLCPNMDFYRPFLSSVHRTPGLTFRTPLSKRVVLSVEFFSRISC